MPLSRLKRTLVIAASSLALLAAPALTQEAPTREPVAWDLTSLYPDVAAWDAAREEVLAEIPELAAMQDGFGRNARSVADFMDAVSALAKKAYRVASYANLNADEDLRDGERRERRGQSQRMLSEFSKSIAWVDPAVLAIGEARIERFIAQEPRLQKHAFALRNTLREAPHTLSEEGERIMAAAGLALGGAQRVYSQLKNSDIPWPTITLSTGEEIRLDASGYVKARAAENREDRVKVFEAFYSTYEDFQTSLGETMNSHVLAQVFNAEQRNYPNALAAALADDNVPEAVYRTLVEEVNRSLPTLHRYMKLRGRMLGIEDLSYHDIYPDMIRTDTVFDLKTSNNIAAAAAQPLGEDYQAKLCDALDQSWVHAYPSQGKRSGAYMSGWVYDEHPFILLNHQDTYDSTSTLIHEWGHAMHSVLANEAQPFETARYSIFVAETAAITNEILAQERLLEAAETDDERLYFLGYALEQMRGTYFRQTQFAEFELAIHEAVEAGETLTGEKLTEIYKDIVERYYGEAEGVTDVPDLYTLEWAYIPHFYYNFYVYQYSTSLAASVYFADKIRAGDGEALERYLDMLRAGGSDYPYALKKKAGLDMASPEPYRAVEARMNRIMDEIEAILDRRAAGEPEPELAFTPLPSNACGGVG